ncbi:unnamed protein product [Cuscuta epithymum]|uniref:Uncharacterized protein n=1 Tax=Cuscuta epithymum TaxID=186058 RepID=A0AAV0CT00_9ASTE|nr:unnamed protein product [Cuscuta epithymum]
MFVPPKPVIDDDELLAAGMISIDVGFVPLRTSCQYQRKWLAFSIFSPSDSRSICFPKICSSPVARKVRRKKMKKGRETVKMGCIIGLFAIIKKLACLIWFGSEVGSDTRNRLLPEGYI